jgi:hypothetical protein
LRYVARCSLTVTLREQRRLAYKEMSNKENRQVGKRPLRGGRGSGAHPRFGGKKKIVRPAEHMPPHKADFDTCLDLSKVRALYLDKSRDGGTEKDPARRAHTG